MPEVSVTAAEREVQTSELCQSKMRAEDSLHVHADTSEPCRDAGKALTDRGHEGR